MTKKQIKAKYDKLIAQQEKLKKRLEVIQADIKHLQAKCKIEGHSTSDSSSYCLSCNQYVGESFDK